MTTKSIIANSVGRTLYMAFILAFAANIGAAAWHIVSPESAPQVMASAVRSDEPAYMTGSLGSWRGALPRARSVRVVDRILVQGHAAPQDGVWAGQFDPVTGGIEVIRSAGDLTLAHEYGHALLQDLIVQHTGEGSQSLAVFQRLAETGRTTDPSAVPEWLRNVFDEYRRLPADPYGDTYYSTSFNEYFAESFAWTADRDGMNVAPETLAFLANLERTTR
jgi:hypothetical protein